MLCSIATGVVCPLHCMIQPQLIHMQDPDTDHGPSHDSYVNAGFHRTTSAGREVDNQQSSPKGAAAAGDRPGRGPLGHSKNLGLKKQASTRLTRDSSGSLPSMLIPMQGGCCTVTPDTASHSQPCCTVLAPGTRCNTTCSQTP